MRHRRRDGGGGAGPPLDEAGLAGQRQHHCPGSVVGILEASGSGQGGRLLVGRHGLGHRGGEHGDAVVLHLVAAAAADDQV